MCIRVSINLRAARRINTSFYSNHHVCDFTTSGLESARAASASPSASPPSTIGKHTSALDFSDGPLRVSSMAMMGETKGEDKVQAELVLAIYEVGQCFFHGWGVSKDQKMGVVSFP